MNTISNWEEVPLFDREEAEAAFWAENRPDLRLMERSAAAGEPVSEAGSPQLTTLAEMERQAILGAIRTLNGDKLQAARLLGIGKTTLYRKLKEYGIADPLREE